MSSNASSTTGSAHTSESVCDQILRFQLSERQMHWAVALPFMVCYATALILMFVYNPDPQRPYRAMFSWTHRVSGLCLMFLPMWALLRHWYDRAMHVHNLREVWAWTLDDLEWLVKIGPATLIKKIVLPDQGKFNAAEKINFMFLTATFPLYVISGILIWTHQFAFLAWLLHLSMAATATPLLFGHVFMATVNPDTRVGLSGMITGFVDRHWASHHYGHWYRENFAQAFAVVESGASALAVDSHVEPAFARTYENLSSAPSRPRSLELVSQAPWRKDLPRVPDTDAATERAADGAGWINSWLQPDSVSDREEDRASSAELADTELEEWTQQPLPSFLRSVRPRSWTGPSWLVADEEDDDVVNR